MIRQILCWLGFHDYDTFYTQKGIMGLRSRRCTYCSKSK